MPTKSIGNRAPPGRRREIIGVSAKRISVGKSHFRNATPLLHFRSEWIRNKARNMTDTNSTAPGLRCDGWDHIRGLAAVAVVLLHGAYAYSYEPLAGLLWVVPLDEPHMAADLVFWAVEGFVMPLFFVMSGFFLAQSFMGRPAGQVFRGRSRRLLIPLMAVGFPVLIIDLWVWGLGLVSMGMLTMKQYVRANYPYDIRMDLFGPAHLWYLQYLWVMCGLTTLGVLAHGHWRAKRAERSGSVEVAHPLARVVGRVDGWTLGGLGMLGGLVVLILAIEPAVVVGFQHNWLPAPAKFLHGLCFLLVGMLLYRSQAMIKAMGIAAPWLFVGATAVLWYLWPQFHATLRTGDGTAFDFSLGFWMAVYAFLACGAAIGAGQRWLARPNRALSELAAASFWVYVAHHPILGLVQLGMRETPLSAGAKFVVGTTLVMVICLATYRVMVKDRLIGQLMDGNLPAWRGKRPVVMPIPDAVPGLRVDETRRAA